MTSKRGTENMINTRVPVFPGKNPRGFLYTFIRIFFKKGYKKGKGVFIINWKLIFAIIFIITGISAAIYLPIYLEEKKKKKN